MENQHRKISGYRELSQEEIDLMNRIKAVEKQAGELVIELMAHPDFDQRWVSIGNTYTQIGFMALVRAVARPQ